MRSGIVRLAVVMYTACKSAGHVPHFGRQLAFSWWRCLIAADLMPCACLMFMSPHRATTTASAVVHPLWERRGALKMGIFYLRVAKLFIPRWTNVRYRT